LYFAADCLLILKFFRRKNKGVYRMANEKRFKVILKEGTPLSDGGIRQILVDTETGVNYLFVRDGSGAGLTPLLDVNGKPIITKNV